jgi:hypothetical protein
MTSTTETSEGKMVNGMNGVKMSGAEEKWKERSKLWNGGSGLEDQGLDSRLGGNWVRRWWWRSWREVNGWYRPLELRSSISGQSVFETSLR